MNDNELKDLQEIITHSLSVIKEKMGDGFTVEKVNLAEMQRLTGLSRSKLRTLKENSFVVKVHGNSGKKHRITVLSGYTYMRIIVNADTARSSWKSIGKKSCFIRLQRMPLMSFI